MVAPAWSRRRFARRLSLGFAAASLAAPDGLSAQAARDAATGIRTSPVAVTLASALLPGAGQAIMRQRRSVAYIILEAAGAGLYISRHRTGRRERDRYRDISRTFARAQFSPDGPVGDWDYYERMEKFIASGAYDAVAGGGVNPEPDPETFNGSIWLLARQTYWRDPDVPPPPSSSEYAAALEFYSGRAVKDEMRWSWVGRPEEFARFRSAISEANAAFRGAGQAASILLANHFLSAVDAYVSIHLRLRKSAGGGIALEGALPLRY
jgi:hypothetical protein